MAASMFLGGDQHNARSSWTHHLLAVPQLAWHMFGPCFLVLPRDFLRTSAQYLLEDR